MRMEDYFILNNEMWDESAMIKEIDKEQADEGSETIGSRVI